MIDNSMDSRKRAFGIAMYDYLSPLTKSADFYAANDKLTELVRPNIILAQKEIQALAARRVKQKEALAKAEADRAAAFPTKAENYGQKLFNIGKAGLYHGGEAKIKTELTVTDRLIKGHKEDFGVALFNAFAEAEDKEGFLPTDRQIRNVYDTCRQDLTTLEQQKKAKEDEIVELGGRRVSSETPSIVQKPSAVPVNATINSTGANSTFVAASTFMETNDAPFSATNQNTGYGATTTPQQSAPFPTTTQQSPAMVQVAGSGIFSHIVPSNASAPASGGYSDNAGPFHSVGTQQGFQNQALNNAFAPQPAAAPVDPFSAFTNQPPPSSSQQQGQSADPLVGFF